MASLDNSAAEVFALAGKLAKTDAEIQAIETERTLEIIYQARWARRHSNASSRTNSPELQQIAGWN